MCSLCVPCGPCPAGDNSSCAGCDGKPNSGLVEDECGECGGDGGSCRGCDGVLHSGKEVDECGVCGGNGQSCRGCDGEMSMCSVCGGTDEHCEDAYQLSLEEAGGSCLDQVMRVHWQAPSTHSALRLRVSSPGFPCRLKWRGGSGEMPADLGAFDSEYEDLAPSRWLELEAGFAGCGEECARGWAEFVAASDALKDCQISNSPWSIRLEQQVPQPAAAGVGILPAPPPPLVTVMMSWRNCIWRTAPSARQHCQIRARPGWPCPTRPVPSSRPPPPQLHRRPPRHRPPRLHRRRRRRRRPPRPHRHHLHPP